MKMSKEAIAQAEILIQQKYMADMALQKFLEGVKLGMKLNGDYNLDTKTWTFAKAEAKKC